MVFSLYFCTLCCVCWQLSCKCQPDWSWMNQSPPLPLDAAAARKKERKKHKMRDRCGRKGVEHTQPAPPSTRKNPSRKRRKCCCVRRTLSRNGRTSGGPRPLVISIDPVPCRTQSPNIDKIPASQFSLLSLLSLQWQRLWLVDGETTVQKGSMSSCDEIEKKKDGPYFFFFPLLSTWCTTMPVARLFPKETTTTMGLKPHDAQHTQTLSFFSFFFFFFG